MTMQEDAEPGPAANAEPANKSRRGSNTVSSRRGTWSKQIQIDDDVEHGDRQRLQGEPATNHPAATQGKQRRARHLRDGSGGQNPAAADAVHI